MTHIRHKHFSWPERRDYRQHLPALERGETIEIPCKSHGEAKTVRFSALRSLKRIAPVKVRSSVRGASVFLVLVNEKSSTKTQE